jgi:hypothetical protein
MTHVFACWLFVSEAPVESEASQCGDLWWKKVALQHILVQELWFSPGSSLQ